MQGTVGANVSKHHVYVLACIFACMCVYVCVLKWASLKKAEDCMCLWWTGKYLMGSYTNEYGCLPWCATCLTYCSIAEVWFVRTEESWCMCANPRPFLFLKALQLCRVQSLCRLYNLYMQTLPHKLCLVHSASLLASPHPILSLQLLLSCFVHPLSLPSNPRPLSPVYKSVAAVHGAACAGYEIY